MRHWWLGDCTLFNEAHAKHSAELIINNAEIENYCLHNKKIKLMIVYAVLSRRITSIKYRSRSLSFQIENDIEKKMTLSESTL